MVQQELAADTVHETMWIHNRFTHPSKHPPRYPLTASINYLSELFSFTKTPEIPNLIGNSLNEN